MTLNDYEILIEIPTGSGGRVLLRDKSGRVAVVTDTGDGQILGPYNPRTGMTPFARPTDSGVRYVAEFYLPSEIPSGSLLSEIFAQYNLAEEG